MINTLILLHNTHKLLIHLPLLLVLLGCNFLNILLLLLAEFLLAQILLLTLLQQLIEVLLLLGDVLLGIQ